MTSFANLPRFNIIMDQAPKDGTWIGIDVSPMDRRNARLGQYDATWGKGQGAWFDKRNQIISKPWGWMSEENFRIFHNIISNIPGAIKLLPLD